MLLPQDRLRSFVRIRPGSARDVPSPPSTSFSRSDERRHARLDVAFVDAMKACRISNPALRLIRLQAIKVLKN